MIYFGCADYEWLVEAGDLVLGGWRMFQEIREVRQTTSNQERMNLESVTMARWSEDRPDDVVRAGSTRPLVIEMCDRRCDRPASDHCSNQAKLICVIPPLQFQRERTLCRGWRGETVSGWRYQNGE
jgi:hypothetical protein